MGMGKGVGGVISIESSAGSLGVGVGGEVGGGVGGGVGTCLPPRPSSRSVSSRPLMGGPMPLPPIGVSSSSFTSQGLGGGASTNNLSRSTSSWEGSEGGGSQVVSLVRQAHCCWSSPHTLLHCGLQGDGLSHQRRGDQEDGHPAGTQDSFFFTTMCTYHNRYTPGGLMKPGTMMSYVYKRKEGP